MYATYKYIKARRAEKNPSHNASGNPAGEKKKESPCRHQRQRVQIAPSSRRNSQNSQEQLNGDYGNPQGESIQLIPINPHAPDGLPPAGPCALCKKSKRDARVYRWKLIVGLMLPHFLASIDLTIVAAALPFIASDFSTFPLPNEGIQDRY